MLKPFELKPWKSPGHKPLKQGFAVCGFQYVQRMKAKAKKARAEPITTILSW
jgi:hypothetical protein